MIRNLNNLKPKINDKAYVNEAAYVVGEVEIDEFSSVWPGAVIRADSGKISIGKRSNIQDNSAVHSDNGSIIGDDVTIGHGVVIHSKKIGNGTLIGNGAVLNDEVTIRLINTISGNLNTKDMSEHRLDFEDLLENDLGVLL